MAVDDSAPQLVVNRPATTLQKKSPRSDELYFTLTQHNLHVVDEDTDSDFVMYWVIDRPQKGRLIKNGRIANMWTQGRYYLCRSQLLYTKQVWFTILL